MTASGKAKITYLHIITKKGYTRKLDESIDPDPTPIPEKKYSRTSMAQTPLGP